MTAETPLPGTPVLHEQYGAGRVRDVVRGGRAIVVHFERYGAVDIQVPLRELRVLPFESASSEAPEITVDPAEPEQLQLLEALRLGTVPGGGLDLYTVGRERELAAIEADLREVEARGGSARVVLGDYGSGKTHLLECVATRALHEGYVVARASLDPVDVPASHPRRVYRPLASDLSYPDGETARGVLPLLERAVASEAVRKRFDRERHLYLTPALRLFERLGSEAAAPLCDWLEGSPQAYTPELNDGFGLAGDDRLPPLLDYRPWAHVYAYLLSGMAGLARASGWRGLVVLLDEGELFRSLNSENRGFAERLFRALMAAALPAAELPFVPANEPRGGFGALKTLPHRFGPDSPIYVVLAMTPLRDADDVVHGMVRRERVAELSALGLEDYRQLARKLVLVYARRHPPLANRVEPLSALLGELIHTGLSSGRFASPRAAVKFVVELLDLARWTPDRVPKFIDGVKRLFL